MTELAGFRLGGLLMYLICVCAVVSYSYLCLLTSISVNGDYRKGFGDCRWYEFDGGTWKVQSGS